MKQVSAYKCGYCAMTSMRKGSVARHEKKSCRANPNRATCLNCIHYFDEGEDDNGMEGQYRQTWREAGCMLDCVDLTDDHYAAKNIELGCTKFQSKHS